MSWETGTGGSNPPLSAPLEVPPADPAKMQACGSFVPFSIPLVLVLSRFPIGETGETGTETPAIAVTISRERQAAQRAMFDSIGLSFQGGLEREVQSAHELLRLRVAEVVIDRGHRAVRLVAEPGVDDPLRNPRVDVPAMPLALSFAPGASVSPSRVLDARESMSPVMIT